MTARASERGWKGWDEYAPFYDWENARTLGRRDIPFWRRLASAIRGPVLELGCGTGRVSLPLARAGIRMVGVDRSEPMLVRAADRRDRARRRMPRGALRMGLVRSDVRALPFAPASFGMVLAPYGMLQSLMRDRDLRATLDACRAVLTTGGVLAIDLVPDVPRWKEYRRRVQLRGRAGGARLTLVESVRQDRRRRLTVFDHEYQRRQGSHVSVHRFTLTFRTVPVARMTRLVER
jgi:SAM-dependent methyltransferase